MIIYKNFQTYNLKAVVTMVTPEMAKGFLEKMCINRKARTATVKRYAHQMKIGQWKINGECLVFTTSGVMIDGQHRCLAIIESGIPVPMTLLYGIAESRDVLATLDDGQKRTLADRLTMTGQVTNNILASTLRSMLQGTRQGGGKSFAEATVIDLMDGYKIHYEAIDFAVAQLKSKKGIESASVAGAIARAYYHIEPTQLSRFCTALVNNYCTEPDERPATMLHSYLMSTCGYGGGWILRVERYGKTERALHAFMNKRTVSKLFASTEELFPLPSEK